MDEVVTLVVRVALGLLTAWVIESAWNALIPTLLHGPTINYNEGCAIFSVLFLIAQYIRFVKINDKK